MFHKNTIKRSLRAKLSHFLLTFLFEFSNDTQKYCCDSSDKKYCYDSSDRKYSYDSSDRKYSLNSNRGQLKE